jgi:hypothetical protein
MPSSPNQPPAPGDYGIEQHRDRPKCAGLQHRYRPCLYIRGMGQHEGSSPPTLLIDILTDRQRTPASDLCAEGARFRSPFTDYVGRDTIIGLVELIRQVLEELRIERQLSDSAATISTFSARVGSEPVQGVLVEERNETAQLVDAMLTVRPYSGLRLAMAAMNELMSRTPPWNERRPA